MGSLHDHVINFKVDLDVAGLNNSLLRTYTTQEEVEQPWYDDDWGTTVIQQRIHREYITNEDEARLKLPGNLQGGYAIVNKDELNRWGVPRGYAVHPGYSPIHNVSRLFTFERTWIVTERAQTVVGSKRLLKNANWAKYNFAVTKRKDSEPSSSAMYNMQLPGDPQIDFDRFFDGENITQEDLVAWVNIGMHHIVSVSASIYCNHCQSPTL